MNSRAKYEELQHEGDSQTANQKSTHIILDTLSRVYDARQMQVFLEKAYYISKSAPNLSPLVVIELAAEEARVDQLCN